MKNAQNGAPEAEDGTPSDERSVAVNLNDYRAIESVKMPVIAELDRGTISMQELLRIDVGDILPFSRPIGENIELFAGDVLIGNAEILAVSDKLAVRVADVNVRLTSSQARKQALSNPGTVLVPKVRRLGSNGA